MASSIVEVAICPLQMALRGDTLFEIGRIDEGSNHR